MILADSCPSLNNFIIRMFPNLQSEKIPLLWLEGLKRKKGSKFFAGYRNSF